MTNQKVVRPSLPHHFGTARIGGTFNDVYNRLPNDMAVSYVTNAGTPFEAKAHVATRGPRRGQRCIKITRDGKARAYIYECCWGRMTNCTRTHINIYTEIL